MALPVRFTRHFPKAALTIWNSATEATGSFSHPKVTGPGNIVTAIAYRKTDVRNKYAEFYEKMRLPRE